MFPPTPLLSKTVAKAARNGAFGIAAIPYMPGALWWQVLQNATVKTIMLTLQHLRLSP